MFLLAKKTFVLRSLSKKFINSCGIVIVHERITSDTHTALLLMTRNPRYSYSSTAVTDRVFWPAGIIDLADRSFNTVLEWQKNSSRKSMKAEFGEHPVKQLVLDERRFPSFCAVNSRREIVVKHSDDEIKIIIRTVKCKAVKLPEPKEVKRIMRRTLGLGVDNNNELYVVSYRTTRTTELLKSLLLMNSCVG